MLGSDAVLIASFVALVTVALWVAHGGFGELVSGSVATMSAVGQLSGLVAALAALGGLVLSSRPRAMERRFGQDQLLASHRWFGITTVLALTLHAVADTWAWGASTGGFISGLIDLLSQREWMVAALVATALMLVIGLSSWRRLRQLLPYETWYFIHLTGYLAVLLGFGHQLTLGTDFVSDRLAFWWWTALASGVAALVIWSRVGDVVRSLTLRFHVTAVSREANQIGSIHVSGTGLRRLRVAGGQYFGVRMLTRDLWWQSHPLSVSAAPSTAGLRFTIKELGDDSTRLLSVPVGTRLMLEGPYGRFTAERAAGAPVVLVAGGVGITPIRAILEDCDPSQRPMVIVRVRDADDVAHRVELERLVELRNGSLHVLAGRREWFTRHDPFAAASLRAWVPDLNARHVFVCGPASLEAAVVKGMRAAGVPTSHIHRERFGV